MARRFVGKRVIITGASAGIGAAAARQFAAEGAHVVLAARRREALEVVAGQIGRDRALVVPMDVRDFQAGAALLERAQTHLGGIDILVNNAGYHARGALETRSLEELMQMVDVNLRAPIALCRLALPYLRRAGGAIVNVGSLAGRVPSAEAATYCATKFGLRAFSMALAEELEASDISVSLVSPGLVDTEFFAGQIEQIAPQAFLQPVGSAEAVATAILACAHDGRAERTVPAHAGGVCTLGYVFPRGKRWLRPFLEWRGRRRKQQFVRRKRNAGGGG